MAVNRHGADHRPATGKPIAGHRLRRGLHRSRPLAHIGGRGQPLQCPAQRVQVAQRVVAGDLRRLSQGTIDPRRQGGLAADAQRRLGLAVGRCGRVGSNNRPSKTAGPPAGLACNSPLSNSNGCFASVLERRESASTARAAGPASISSASVAASVSTATAPQKASAMSASVARRRAARRPAVICGVANWTCWMAASAACSPCSRPRRTSLAARPGKGQA